MPHFTQTEKKILNLLSDGLPHSREDIHSLLWDSLSKREAIRFHISKVRTKLEPLGHTIVCELGYARKFSYRLVKLVTSTDLEVLSLS